MATTAYDPDRSPTPADWLALDEGDRLCLAQNFHVAARIKVPRMKPHAALHVIVENQIAEGFGPSVRALARLLAGGTSRHEAIHAIGHAVLMHLNELAAEPRRDAGWQQNRLNAAIDALDAKDWKGTRGSR